MNKMILSLFLIICVMIISWCNMPSSDAPLEVSNIVIYEVCNDLSLPCGDVYQKQVDRYSPDEITQHNSRTVDISGNRKIPNIIGEYFEKNNWIADIYNMADGMGGSLIGYTKEDIKCSILGAWELDEEFTPSGDGIISLSCFQD